MSLRCLALLVLSVSVFADECPRSHCSNHGKCVQDDLFEICLCDDDDRRGHFAGNKCQHCLDGFRPPACVEVDLLPDTTWLLLMALVFVFISCGGVLMLRFTCFLTSLLSRWALGSDDAAPVERASDDETPAFPIIDPGNDSEEEQRKAEALTQRQMLAQIAGEGANDEEEEEKDDSLCKICFTHPSNCVLLECGHLCTCFDCGVKLRQCPFCRKPIEKVKKIYRI
eukprot:GGOE01021102.1.p2 GENE.GGOE01021102.1~~GGOE01021102.1.p2  ORF type:complete len:226 (-),score=52.27 GGOE01021102.1:463-1140(-)